MSNLLIQKATIIDPGNTHDGKVRDILIKKGKIAEIKTRIKDPENIKKLDATGAYISPGWIDVGVQTGDPGFEHRETLQTVSQAAAAGGFTAIVCQPNTLPVIHSKSEVLYLQNRADKNLVEVFPIGAISKECQGEDLTEMYDMHHSGAVAFSDGKYPIQNAGLMLRSLQYVKAFNGLIINHPQEDSISKNAQLHEGVVSTTLGMPGFPSIAEQLMLQRDIDLLAYTDSRLHVSNISTVGGVALLRTAKNRGLKITGSTPILNLIFEDNDVENFDSNLKVLPPLREKSDREALLKGLKEGTLDYITSNHIPLEEEVKMVEFPYAKFGAIGLETVYPLLNTYLSKKFSISQIVQMLAINPRKVLQISRPEVKKDHLANLTIFHPTLEWTYSKENIKSKSRNTSLLGKTFTGKILGVVNNNKMEIFLT